MKRRQRPRRPNPAARELADPKYRKRVIKAKKGKASYTRKGRQAYPGALPFCLIHGAAQTTSYNRAIAA